MNLKNLGIMSAAATFLSAIFCGLEGSMLLCTSHVAPWAIKSAYHTILGVLIVNVAVIVLEAGYYKNIKMFK